MIERDAFTYRPYTDCAKCMQENPPLTRQMMGCGWEPPPQPGIPVRALDHDARLSIDMTHEERESKRNQLCPGYTCGLPEVVEASRARVWRDKGSLRDFTKGEQPSDALMLAIDILDAETARATDWSIKNPKKDG